MSGSLGWVSWDMETPFALSLSKPVLSDAAGGVDGGFPYFSRIEREETGFDRLSPNG